METTKRIVILLILVLITAGPAQSEEKRAKEISGTRMASCVVKVTSDPAVLPLSFQTVRQLMHSSGVFGKAARDVLGLPPEECLGLFDIQALSPDLISTPTKLPDVSRSTTKPCNYEHEEMMMYDRMVEEEMKTGNTTSTARTARPRSSSSRPIGTPSRRPTSPAASLTSDIEKTFLFLLEVDFRQASTERDLKPAAEEFMNALIGNLRDAVNRAFDEYSEKLTGQLHLATKEADRAENDLRGRQVVLRDISGSHILYRDRILTDISGLRNNIQKIRMEQASDQVIVDATTKRIAETQAKLQEQIDKDTVIKELMDLLELQVTNYKNLERLHEAGHASPADLGEAQEKLSRTRIELAQRREQLSKSAGGNLIESLNRDLANRSIEAAQNQVHLSSLERQLSEAEKLLEKVDDYELLSLKADIDKQNFQEAIIWRDRMNRMMRMLQPPTVSVIGGQ